MSSSRPTTLQVAQIVPDTLAEGPGRRFAVWVQGCSIHCPGCCNPEMLTTKGGTTWDIAELAQQILEMPVEGVSVLGGEPFEQAEGVRQLCERVRAGGKSTMVFSGYTLAELRAKQDGSVDCLLSVLDLLVDGRYDHQLPETKRRWIGSSNQTMHFLTDRYSPDEPQFFAPNTVELRLSKGSLTVNGWPDLARKLRPKVR